jgi:uncharacterized membrane protein YkoI
MTVSSRRKAVLVAAGVATVAVVGAGAAHAMTDDDATERPITGDALRKASDAALAETGGGRVTDTEVGDEESRYEVEVTLDDGSQVDVQLDDDFAVVGTEGESEKDDD